MNYNIYWSIKENKNSLLELTSKNAAQVKLLVTTPLVKMNLFRLKWSLPNCEWHLSRYVLWADKDNQAAVLQGATRILVAARKKSFKRGAFQNPFVFIWQKAAAKVEPMRKLLV